MKPSEPEMETARLAAEALLEQHKDRYHLGKALLYLRQREALTGRILKHLELYLKFGESTEEHTRLVKLMEELERFEAAESGHQESDFGPF